jgi:LDH2 family malate/lactate/ureidoglycolate dehydrogenase
MRGSNAKTIFVRHGRLHYFIREVLKRLRLPAPHASRVGDALVSADLAGVEGEGSSRLPLFASASGRASQSRGDAGAPAGRGTAAVVDDNGMSHVVSAVDGIAIEMAKKLGVAAVAARNNNDFGMAATRASRSWSR